MGGAPRFRKCSIGGKSYDINVDGPRTADGKPNAPPPRLSDGKPDFSGIWQSARKIPCTPEVSRFVETVPL
jgi:hypothetical protein